MTTSQEHEEFGYLLGRVVDILTEELDLPCKCVGRMTWRREVLDRGLEADDCFYLANAPLVRGKKLDLSVDPPPDLAIEVEISRSALDRMGIYAALRVPEIWRYDGETLRVERLQPHIVRIAEPRIGEINLGQSRLQGAYRIFQRTLRQIAGGEGGKAREIDAIRPAVRLGVGVDFPAAQTCCGQPHFNSGYHDEARLLAQHTIETFAGSPLVVTPSGSCAAMMATATCCRQQVGRAIRQRGT